MIIQCLNLMMTWSLSIRCWTNEPAYHVWPMVLNADIGSEIARSNDEVHLHTCT